MAGLFEAEPVLRVIRKLLKNATAMLLPRLLAWRSVRPSFQGTLKV